MYLCHLTSTTVTPCVHVSLKKSSNLAALHYFPDFIFLIDLITFNAPSGLAPPCWRSYDKTLLSFPKSHR